MCKYVCVCVFVCVCVHLCVIGCVNITLLMFYSVIPSLLCTFFQFCDRFVDCVHKYSLNCCIFVYFPFISYGRSFLTEDHECYYFFYAHLDCSNHALNFFVCSHPKCHEGHRISYHSDEAVIFNISKRKIFRSEMTEDRTRLSKFLPQFI